MKITKRPPMLPRWARVIAEHDRPSPGGHIWLDCIDCAESYSEHHEYLDGVSNDDFGARARALGWTILPTRCPKHAEAQP